MGDTTKCMYTVPYLPTVHGEHLPGDLLHLAAFACTAFMARGGLIASPEELGDALGIDADRADCLLNLMCELQLIDRLPPGGDA